MQKGFTPIYILVGILILGILGGGYYLFFGDFLKPREPVPVVAPAAQVSPVNVTPTPSDETANWKTYTNSKYGFEFKYPPNLILNTNPTAGSDTIFFRGEEDQKLRDSGLIVEGPGNMIALHILTTRSLQEEFERMIVGLENIKITNREVGGYEAKEVIGNLEQFNKIGYSKHLIFQKDNAVFLLGVEWFSDDHLSRYFDQILSTFKFIDQTQASCGPCPQLMPPAPDSCKEGKLVSGGKNECGCPLPPVCQR